MTTPTAYDVIVLGVGGFGSAALYHLARRGARVLGLERFGVAHDRGSSHGETRIIRKAYFEHPDYVPLLRRAYDLWRELEAETHRRLFHQVGLFLAGRPESEVVSGTLEAARIHNLPVERHGPEEARRCFPAYRFDDDFSIVFEQDAGFLEVEHCVAAHIAAAQSHGAQVQLDETAQSWSPEGLQVRVRTNRADYVAGKLIITAGPWASQVLPGGPTRANVEASRRFWAERLCVVRKPAFWFPAGPQFDVASGNTTFFFETPAGQFYGFPRLDGQSIKMAEHTSGDPVADPLTVDRTQHPADLARVAAFLQRFLPSVATTPVKHAVCMYTKSPDGHFFIDRHPDCDRVVLGAGFSGHGFKFTSALGESLAELALEGRSKLPVEFLSLSRALAAPPR